MFDNIQYWWNNIDRKKFFLILAVLVLLAVLFIMLYLAFKKNTQPQIINDNNVNVGFPNAGDNNGNTVDTNGANNGLPEANNQNVNNENGNNGENGSGGETPKPVANTELITVGQAKGATTAGGNLKYYDVNDCKFYETDKSGSKKQIGADSYCDVQNITWSNQGNQAVLQFPDGSNIVYNFDKNKQYSLPKEMNEFSFSPDGSQIAAKYMGENLSDKWVASIKSDGTGLTGIEPMGDNADKVNVEWSGNNQVVALSRTGEPQGGLAQQVLLIGFNGENYKSLYIDGRGFEPKWSPDGKKILYSSYSEKTNYKPVLTLVDGEPDKIGLEQKQFNLNTWSDKCTITQDSAYCAVPINMADGAGFVRDLANNEPDQIWKIDIKNGTASLLSTPMNDKGETLTVSDINVSSDGKWVYFKDNSTGQLKALKVSN